MPTKTFIFRSRAHAALFAALSAALVVGLMFTLEAMSYSLWWLLDSALRWVIQ
jgi:hypothetical protein